MQMQFRSIQVLLALALSLVVVAPLALAQVPDKPGNPRKPDGTLRKPGDSAGGDDEKIGFCTASWTWTNVTARGVPSLKGDYLRRERTLSCPPSGVAGMVE